MEHRFVLRKKKGDNVPAQVYLTTQINRHRFHYYTGQRVAPKDWTGLRMDRNARGQRSVNDGLLKVERVFLNVVYELNKKDKLTMDNLKRFMDYRMGKIKRRDFFEVGTLTSFFEEGLEILKRRGRKVDAYRPAIDKLIEFNPMIDWEDINKKTFLDWVQFLENHPIRPLSKNTISSYATFLKRLFNLAHDEKIYEFDARDIKAWTHGKELTTQIALTLDEIDVLMNEPLEGNRADARDLFIVGCCTGLRSVDILRINPETDIQDGLIRMVTRKTKEEIIVPEHDYLLEILEKRNWELPRMKYDAMLDNIKKVARDSGKFNMMVKKVQTVGGKTEEKMMPRWKMIGTHTARRSFATNLSKLGEPTAVVMRMTGHRTLSSFERYIRMDRDDAVNALKDSPFFRRNKKRSDIG